MYNSLLFTMYTLDKFMFKQIGCLFKQEQYVSIPVLEQLQLVRVRDVKRKAEV